MEEESDQAGERMCGGKNPLLADGEESTLIEFNCNLFLDSLKILQDPVFPLALW